MSRTSVPPPGRRGPRRLRADEDTLAALLAEADALGARITATEAELHQLVAQRRALIRQVHTAGLSVRGIASALHLAAETVQRALRSRDSAD